MDASCCTAEGNLYPGERSQAQALHVHVICNMLRTSGPLLVLILRAGSRRHFSIKKQSYTALNALGSTVTASACIHFGTSLRRLLPSLRDTLGPWRSPQAAHERTQESSLHFPEGCNYLPRVTKQPAWCLASPREKGFQ